MYFAKFLNQKHRLLLSLGKQLAKRKALIIFRGMRKGSKPFPPASNRDLNHWHLQKCGQGVKHQTNWWPPHRSIYKRPVKRSPNTLRDSIICKMIRSFHLGSCANGQELESLSLASGSISRSTEDGPKPHQYYLTISGAWKWSTGQTRYMWVITHYYLLT